MRKERVNFICSSNDGEATMWTTNPADAAEAYAECMAYDNCLDVGDDLQVTVQDPRDGIANRWTVTRLGLDYFQVSGPLPDKAKA